MLKKYYKKFKNLQITYNCFKKQNLKESTQITKNNNKKSK